MIDETSACPYCRCLSGERVVARKESQASIEAFAKIDYSLFECPDCGLYYCAPMTAATIDGLSRYYAECYNNKDRIYDPEKIVGQIWRRKPARDLLRPLYDLLGVTPGRHGEGMALLQARKLHSLLDVGCSYGSFIRAAINRGLDAYGIEPNEEVVKIIRAKGISRISAGSFPDATGPLARYDSLTFFQVLMYMQGPSPEFFGYCRQLLNPGGMLLIFCTDPRHRDTPEVELAIRGPLVLNFTGERFMRRAADEAGFSGYEYIPSQGEPTSCFHVLTA